MWFKNEPAANQGLAAGSFLNVDDYIGPPVKFTLLAM
jgi:hypothetical protein